MTITLSPELASRLRDLAERRCKDANKLVSEILTGYLDEEAIHRITTTEGMSPDEILQHVKALAEEEGAGEDDETYGPASPEAVRKGEEKLGFPLPPPLRDFYLKVGNGGVTSILGIYGGYSLYGAHLEEIYNDFRRFDFTKFIYKGETLDRWPEYLIPFCSWAGGLYICMDCTDEAGPIYIYDGFSSPIMTDAEGSDLSIITPHLPSFKQWLEMWLSGVNLWRESHNISQRATQQAIASRGTRGHGL